MLAACSTISARLTVIGVGADLKREGFSLWGELGQRRREPSAARRCAVTQDSEFLCLVATNLRGSEERPSDGHRETAPEAQPE
jgi:hypothetical protein